MPNRQYIRFYIDRNDRLHAIWFKKREYKFLEPQGHTCNFDFFDPTIAVRSVTIKRSCDKHSISKVKYCYTSFEAQAVIDARLARNKEACLSNLTFHHYLQLCRAPMKYVEAFSTFIADKYGEEARCEVIRQIIRATHEKELRKEWAKENSPVVWPFWR